MSIALVILAAGASNRMGTIKQLLPWQNTVLLGHAIEQAQKSSASKIIVVLGANTDVILPKIAHLKPDILINEQWEKGMGTSITCSVNYLKSNKYECAGVLFALADQPLIKAAHYNSIISAFTNTEKKIVATAMKEMVGVPALFCKTLFNKLSVLSEDIGAKKIISENANLVHSVKSREPLTDIDTLETYHNMFKEYGS